MAETPMSTDAKLVVYTHNDNVVIVALRSLGDEVDIAQMSPEEGDEPFDYKLQHFNWLVNAAAAFHNIPVERVVRG